MKAVAVLPASREVRLIDDHPVPRVRRGTDVKLRMLDVGVCGTDKEICAFEYGTPPAGFRHLVIGHESLGQVVEVGDRVDGLAPGDLVVPMVRRPCKRKDCTACRGGRQDFCFTGAFVERGIQGAHGFMTEYVVDDAAYVHRVPARLADVAVLVEPLTIAEKALEQIADVQERLPWTAKVGARSPALGHGHRAVVLGAGPVGLLGAMALVARGFETYVYSREAAPNPKSDLVESFGGIYVSSTQTTVAQLAERVGNLDVVYEAVGASSLAFDVMRVLGTNGIFVFTGVPGRKAPIRVDTDALMRNLVLRNQVVFGTVNAGQQTFAHAIRDLGRFAKTWPGALRALITGRFAPAEHEALLNGKQGGIKNVVHLADAA